MGNYLNPGNEKFRRMIQSEIYVDKTGMIKYTNSVLDTAQNYVCVSRPRRFGKSMAANMLTAYYSRGCDSKKLFHSFEIAKDKDFEKYLNQYNTIFLNMQEFLSRSYNVEKLIERVKKLVIRDLKMEYPEVDYFDDTDLIESMQDIYAQTQCPFVVIIDEWDCIFREYKKDKEAQEKYLDVLEKQKSNLTKMYNLTEEIINQKCELNNLKTDEWLEKMAAEMAAEIGSVKKDEKNVIVDAEKHAAWGRIGLFDEDELLERLEMHLFDDKKYPNLDIDDIEKRIDERRVVVEKKLAQINPDAIHMLKEHRKEMLGRVKLHNPYAYEHMMEQKRKHYEHLKKKDPELAQKLKIFYNLSDDDK